MRQPVIYMEKSLLNLTLGIFPKPNSHQNGYNFKKCLFAEKYFLFNLLLQLIL